MATSKKKIGLATCFLDNCGACLQAFALQEAISDLGFDCQIIRFTEPGGYEKHASLLRRLIRIPVYYIRGKRNPQYADNVKRHRKFNAFRKNLRFYPVTYHTTQEIYDDPPECDAFVCGSDQIWNPTFYNRNNPVYHLDFAPEGIKRIAYAPSIGLAQMPKEYEAEFSRYILKYSNLSVREDQGSEIVQRLTGKSCPVVLDPTLLISASSWREKLQIKNASQKYIFLYLFGTRDYIGEFIAYVRTKTDLPIVCIPFCDRERNPEYIQHPTADPKEFVELISNAELVITDSFHATAFSINLNKRFYTLLRNESTDTAGMNSRITSILKATGLEARLISSKEAFPSDLFEDINYDACNAYLEKKRCEDTAYLRNALEGAVQ